MRVSPVNRYWPNPVTVPSFEKLPPIVSAVSDCVNVPLFVSDPPASITPLFVTLAPLMKLPERTEHVLTSEPPPLI